MTVAKVITGRPKETYILSDTEEVVVVVARNNANEQESVVLYPAHSIAMLDAPHASFQFSEACGVYKAGEYTKPEAP